MASSKSTSIRPIISILGSGNMGRAIGICLSRAGYPVFFGGRNPSAGPKNATKLALTQGGTVPAQAGTIAEAARIGEVLIWTIRERNVKNVLGDDGVAALKEKNSVTVIDLNNWNLQDVLETGKGATLDKIGLGEQLQESFEEEGIQAVVVKAFNTLPMELFALSKEELQREGVQVFVAGGGVQSGSKNLCIELITSMGFVVVDLGDDAMSMRMVEMMGDVMRFCLSRGAGNQVWSHLSIKGVPPVSLATIGERQAGYT